MLRATSNIQRLWASTLLRSAAVRTTPASGLYQPRQQMSRKVNDVYQPGRPTMKCPTPAASCTRSPCMCATTDAAGQLRKSLVAKYDDGKEWSLSEVEDATNKHVLFTWGASQPMARDAIPIQRGEGVYFVDMDGKKYLDFNSQAMCSHLGHTVPDEISDAIVEQMKEIPYMYPCTSVSPIRAKLCSLLADMVPGDINSFLFPSGGAESNEVALRAARVFTGRHKVIARYRSYHGGTLGGITLTGDQRRWTAELGATGIVHAFDPYPYSFSFGDTPEDIAQRSLDMLHEQIAYEGPHKIAAIFLESITGTNGILKPPPGYLEGVREMCDKYGILMVCDEVMAGFGRTGKLFGFCHAPTVVPDIVTFAKGVNAAILPLGGVGVRDELAEYFRNNPISIGSTYNGHPLSLASAYATLKYYLKHDVIQHVAAMEEHLLAGLQRLLDNHPSVKQARGVGLFGCIDLQKNTQGAFAAEVTDPPTPALAEFKRAVFDAGLFTMMRGHTVFCNPPLISTPQELKEGFDILDNALHIMDNALEK